MFQTTGVTSGIVAIEIINKDSGLSIGSLVADVNSSWHRKTTSITVPSGVSNVAIRLVVAGPVASGRKAFSRIKFTYGSKDVPYTNEGDTGALFTSVSNGKSAVAAAITDMGVTTAADAPFATMATNIRAINTGKKSAIGTFVINSSGQATVAGLGFQPRNIIINDATYPSGTENTFFLVYSADAYTLRSGSQETLNQTRGKNNGTQGDSQISVTTSGFTINAPSVNNGRTYRYVATN